jgi:hypothetical protein
VFSDLKLDIHRVKFNCYPLFHAVLDPVITSNKYPGTKNFKYIKEAYVFATSSLEIFASVFYSVTNHLFQFIL